MKKGLHQIRGFKTTIPTSVLGVCLAAMAMPIYAGDAPVFTKHPQSIMVAMGGTVRLACLITGTPPISMSWQKDSAILSEQANATLVITNVQSSDSGQYLLRASNEVGLAHSEVATVVVYTNHFCDFPPSWVSCYETISPAEAIPWGAMLLGYAQGLVPDGAGNVYVAALGYSVTTFCNEGKVLKLDQEGRLAWVADFFDSSPYNADRPNAVGLDAVGNVLVAGDSHYDNRQIYTVSKYNPDGTRLWGNRFTNSCGNTGSATPYAIDTDADGNVYVAGNVGVVKYSSGGDFVWSSCGQYNRALLRLIPNGEGYYVASMTSGSPSALGVARFDTNGAALWSTNLNFGPGITDEDLNGRGIAVDRSNNICLSATSRQLGVPLSEDIVTVKFDVGGNHLWTRRYGAANRTDSANDFTVDGSGNIIVVGDTWASPSPPANGSDYTGLDILVLKYDPEGNLVWSANYGGSPGCEDRANCVAVDREGNIYVMGVSRTNTDVSLPWDSVILKYSPDGALMWKMRRADYPWFLEVDSAGDVFAAGTRMFVGDASGHIYNELLAMKLGQNEPRLAVCTGLQDGSFHGSFVSLRGSRFEILAADNLMNPGWQSVETATNFNGLVPFHDKTAGQYAGRFYRARIQ